MSAEVESVNRGGLKYATTFDEKIFGVGCDVDVVVDLGTGEASATIAMRQFLRSSPAFRIAERDLEAIADAVKTAKASIKLLDSLADGALDHQLNFSAGGASLIVVHPKGKTARYVLTIGMFNDEGDIAELSSVVIDAAVKRIGELKERVSAKATPERDQSRDDRTEYADAEIVARQAVVAL